MDLESHALNYEALAKAYVEGLHTNLRNFKVGPEFLETWVHSEDHFESIYGIFEAAETAGVPALAVQINSQTAREFDTKALEKELSKIGSVQVSSVDKGGLVFEMQFKKKSSEFQIHACYQKEVKKAASQIAFDGVVEEKNLKKDEVLVQTTQDGITLSCSVDCNGLVVLARHQGAQALDLVLCDQLCALMVGRSMQEINDHAVIRLEYKLRDHALPSPVVGILTPENADPVFKRPQLLVRKLFNEYVLKVKAEVGKNFWDDQPLPQWLALKTDERIEKVKTTLRLACKELGLQEIGWEVVTIRDDVRIVMSFTQDPHKPNFGAHMIKLERLLRERLEPRLELQLESLTDRNKRIERTARVEKPKLFKH